MKRALTVCALLLLGIAPAVAQNCATTDTGEQVILSEDGTWRYAEGNECETQKSTDPKPAETTEVLIGSDRYPAGKQEIIIEDDLLGNIKAQVVNKNGQALLVFWQENTGGCSNRSIFGSAGLADLDSRLFLSNGEVLRFIDRGNKGKRTLKDARDNPDSDRILEDERIDVCQKWISYRITKKEIGIIKNSYIERVEIKTGMRSEPSLYSIRKNRNTLSDQLKSLGF